MSSPKAFIGEFNIEAALGLIYIVAGATFVTYLLIAMAIKRMRPTTMAMYNYVQPFISSLVAVAVGQDSFSIEKCCAAVLVFGGVYLVTSSVNPLQNQNADNKKA
ncbi:MAG: EamA family transporter [Bacilli bacterium]